MKTILKNFTIALTASGILTACVTDNTAKSIDKESAYSKYEAAITKYKKPVHMRAEISKGSVAPIFSQPKMATKRQIRNILQSDRPDDIIINDADIIVSAVDCHDGDDNIISSGGFTTIGGFSDFLNACKGAGGVAIEFCGVERILWELWTEGLD